MYIFECVDCFAKVEKQTKKRGRDGKHRCKLCGQRKADKKHYIKNRIARINAAAKWNRENKEKRKATTRAYLSSEYGKAIVNAKQKRNYWKNPEYYRLKNRAKVHGISVVELLQLTQNNCRLCGINKNITIDHMHPQNKGGGSNKENLQVLCFSCNVWKSDNLFLADGSGYLVGESYVG